MDAQELLRQCIRTVTAIVCFLHPSLLQGGILLFQLIDQYGPSGISLLIIAGFETTVIAWVYGGYHLILVYI